MTTLDITILADNALYYRWARNVMPVRVGGQETGKQPHRSCRVAMSAVPVIERNIKRPAKFP